MGEVIFLAVIGVLDVVMFGLTFAFPTSIIDQSGGPGLFPRLVLAGLLVLVVIRIAVILHSESERGRRFIFLEIFKGSRLVFLVVFVAYALLMTTLGFVLSTGVFLAVTILFLFRCQYQKWMGPKGIAATVIGSAVGALVIYLLFTRWFNVVLPAGLLNF